MNSRTYKSHNFGFTLIEIIVATTIFVITVSAILVLFGFVLRTNREVQINRKAAQSIRNFTEVLAREIRNGKIYYGTAGTDCATGNYSQSTNQTLAILTVDGDLLCFSLRTVSSQGQMNLQKITTTGTLEEVINSSSMYIKPGTFRFIIQPETDPYTQSGGLYPGIQPMVTIAAEFVVEEGNSSVTIPYQTSISSDVYDIPNL
ncbi:MAG: type II secretion system protein [Candidatus Doudnabacteria bacterium]